VVYTTPPHKLSHSLLGVIFLVFVPSLVTRRLWYAQVCKQHVPLLCANHEVAAEIAGDGGLRGHAWLEVARTADFKQRQLAHAIEPLERRLKDGSPQVLDIARLLVALGRSLVDGDVLGLADEAQLVGRNLLVPRVPHHDHAVPRYGDKLVAVAVKVLIAHQLPAVVDLSGGR